MPSACHRSRSRVPLIVAFSFCCTTYYRTTRVGEPQILPHSPLDNHSLNRRSWSKRLARPEACLVEAGEEYVARRPPTWGLAPQPDNLFLARIVNSSSRPITAMSSSLPGTRELPPSQYDLGTYMGRVRHTIGVTDPR